MNTADVLRDLVIANRILAHEGVVDAYGHISVRHPERSDRFFLSGSRSPELVTLDDIIEYDLDCNPIDLRGRAQYTERPIHGGIYRKRPDVISVVHNHAYEVIPFTVAQGVKLETTPSPRGRDRSRRFRSGTFASGSAIPTCWSQRSRKARISRTGLVRTVSY